MLFPGQVLKDKEGNPVNVEQKEKETKKKEAKPAAPVTEQEGLF